ncbi:RebB family R body protein [Ideonella sp. DXS29W]|uniref:RebB family R body protein n=1 Tax=Ideonella lacteola TaxID=2984193 RepID=A0ABU9BNU8_9BURK
MSATSGVARIAGPLGEGSALAIGLAPSFAMGMTYVAMADSLGLAMENAVANQQRGQVLAGAALAQVLALIITKGAASS